MSQKHIIGPNFMIPESVLRFPQNQSSGRSRGGDKSSTKPGLGHEQRSNIGTGGTTEPSQTQVSTKKHKQQQAVVVAGTTHQTQPRPPKPVIPAPVPVPLPPRQLWTFGRCPHLESFKRSPQMASYIPMHSVFFFPHTEHEHRVKALFAQCVVCTSLITTHACLKCSFVGCVNGGHFTKHFEEMGHELAANLLNGGIYCFLCCDIFQDVDFRSPKSRSRPMGMRRVVPFHRKSKAAGIYRGIFPKPSLTSTKSMLGLRGLINLGHTCCMSSIVQALIHTPILRDFFLSSEIRCAEKHDKDRKKPCIVSLVADLYQQFYNGMKTAMSLHDLLFKIWANAAHLAGYEQQDAHEFFIAMLEALHLHFLASDKPDSCRCVIDVIFLGKLESAVTCMKCEHKSITIDPFWDTSLDLMTENGVTSLKLSDCLTRYTRIEHLGTTGKILCSICKNNQESTKQLKFKTLPMVLCLHLKRFEHRTNYKKIDTRVEFPECLTMDEYTSTSSALSGEDSGTVAVVSTVQQDNSRYSLYAVVNHVGSLDGGHYYAYIRHAEGTWYKCDDHWVTIVDKSEVLASPGYLLFYHNEVRTNSIPNAHKSNFN